MPMNKLPLIPLLIALASCDPPQAEHCPVADLALADPEGFHSPSVILREQGPPQGLYLTAIGGDTIHRAEFTKLVAACAGQTDPPLTVTLSWYQPDLTSDARVVGLGYSMLSDEALWGCYVDAFKSNNPVAF